MNDFGGSSNQCVRPWVLHLWTKCLKPGQIPNLKFHTIAKIFRRHPVIEPEVLFCQHITPRFWSKPNVWTSNLMSDHTSDDFSGVSINRGTPKNGWRFLVGNPSINGWWYGGTSLFGIPKITTQTPWILPPGPLSQAAAPGDKKGRRPVSQELGAYQILYGMVAIRSLR